MSGEDLSSYAPKSPDLSSFFPAGPTQEPPPQPLDNTYSPPRQPPTVSPFQPTAPLPNQQYLPPQRHPSGPYDPRPVHQDAPSPSYPQAEPRPEYPHYAPPPHRQPYASPGYHHQQAPPLPAYNPGYPVSPYGQQPIYPEHLPYPTHPGIPAGPGYAPGGQPYISHGGPGPEMPTRRAAAAAAAAAMTAGIKDEADEFSMPAQAPAPVSQHPAPSSILEPSPVRTKFPTARIKRIMQADEEVGKVAQQTPIAVGKALELFMVQLVTKSADIAKTKGSKRVTAQMLKQVVEDDDQWDFLRDIVGKVENEKDGGRSKAKVETDSDDDDSEPRKKGRGGRKKKSV